MKENIDLTVDRVFSQRQSNDTFYPWDVYKKKKITADVLLRALGIKFPWQSIEKELNTNRKMIYEGNKYDRKHALNIDESVDDRYCYRCGIKINKPWVNQELCSRCNEDLERDITFEQIIFR